MTFKLSYIYFIPMKNSMQKKRSQQHLDETAYGKSTFMFVASRIILLVASFANKRSDSVGGFVPENTIKRH